MKLIALRPCSFGGKRFYIGEEVPEGLVLSPKLQAERGTLQIIKDNAPVEAEKEPAPVEAEKEPAPVEAEPAWEPLPSGSIPKEEDSQEAAKKPAGRKKAGK